MEIIKNYDGKELTLVIKGHIDTITSKNLEKEINSEDGNFNSLTLDFTDVEYISSAGLRVLISTHKKSKPDNIPFIIKNVNEPIIGIFRITGFDQILTIR